jgi:hypothetical protein
MNEDRPLFAFTGKWTTFNGDRGTKSKPNADQGGRADSCLRRLERPVASLGAAALGLSLQYRIDLS